MRREAAGAECFVNLTPQAARSSSSPLSSAAPHDATRGSRMKIRRVDAAEANEAGGGSGEYSAGRRGGGGGA